MSDIRIYSAANMPTSPLTGDVVICSDEFNLAPANSVHLCTNATGPVWKSFANDSAVAAIPDPFSTHFTSAQYLSLTNSISLSGPFTVSAWFRLDTGATDGLNRMLIGRVTGGTNYLSYANLDGSFTTRHTGNTTGITLSADSSTWYHFAHIRNASNVQKVYINGIERSSASNSTAYTFDWIGGSDDYLDNTWGGNIDEVGLWHSDQTSNLSSLYTGSTTPPDYSALSPDYLWRMGDADSATNGDPVVSITESMDTGNHAVQSTAANQPTFSTDVPS